MHVYLSTDPKARRQRFDMLQLHQTRPSYTPHSCTAHHAASQPAASPRLSLVYHHRVSLSSQLRSISSACFLNSHPALSACCFNIHPTLSACFLGTHRPCQLVSSHADPTSSACLVQTHPDLAFWTLTVKMADIVSAVASVAGLVSLSIQLLESAQKLKGFYNSY